MKNKFLNTCAGIGIVLFAAGFFIRSFNTANAVPAEKVSKKAVVGDSFSPVGISGGFAYYFSFDGNGYGSLRKSPLDSAE